MPRLSLDVFRRYGYPVLLVGLANAIRLTVYPTIGDHYPVILFFAAIVLAVAYGGYGPSLLALTLSWLSVVFLFLLPHADPVILGSKAQIATVFMAVGLGLCMLGGTSRAARERALSRSADLRRALEAQQAERDWLQITLASIADAVITTDPQGLVIFLNPVAARLTGWNLQEAMGHRLSEVLRTVQETSRRTDDLPISRVVGDGEVVVSDDEVVLIARNGTARSVEHCAAPIKDSDGKIQGVVIIFRDVTERHRAEQAQRESEERFRQLAENIDDVFWIHDLRGSKTTYVSPAYETLWGSSCESLYERPMSYLDAVHPEDRERVLRAFRRLERGEASAGEYRIIRPEGAIRWIWDRGFPIRDESGRTVRLAGIAEDITERKRAEQALRESEKRFRTLADATPVLIWGTDSSNRCNYFNKPWLHFTGRTTEQEIGEGWTGSVHPDDLQCCLKTRAAAMHSSTSFTIEYRLRRRDGKYRWLLDNGVPRFAPDGVFSGYIGSCIDITDRKQIEEELRKSDRRKEEFLAVLSHELRNPLAPIQTAVDLLERTAIRGAGANRELGMIQRQVQTLRRLVDDLLDVSRISRGKIELRKEHIGLSALVAQAVEAVRPLFDEHQQELHVSVPEEPIILEADPTRLEQILFNLLINAAKYTPQGGEIWLDIRPVQGEVLIRVRDTGIGIEPDLLPKVFDLFLQGERRVGLSHEGGGIGLSLAKNLVELHGGTITAHSEGPDRGSEFVVKLPTTSGLQSKPIQPRETVHPAASDPLSRRRILIVDDNVQAADSLGRLMSAVFDQEVRVGYNGKSALELAASFLPEIILLDLDMTGMDGYEVVMRLRERSEFAQTRIVAVTGWGHEEDRRRSREMGFDMHLVKPLTANDLRVMLCELEHMLLERRHPQLVPELAHQ